MDEVVEVSVGALHLLARSPENRQTMRQLNTIRLFVQVYYTYMYIHVHCTCTCTCTCTCIYMYTYIHASPVNQHCLAYIIPGFVPSLLSWLSGLEPCHEGCRLWVRVPLSFSNELSVFSASICLALLWTYIIHVRTMYIHVHCTYLDIVHTHVKARQIEALKADS